MFNFFRVEESIFRGTLSHICRGMVHTVRSSTGNLDLSTGGKWCQPPYRYNRHVSGNRAAVQHGRQHQGWPSQWNGDIVIRAGSIKKKTALEKSFSRSSGLTQSLAGETRGWQGLSPKVISVLTRSMPKGDKMMEIHLKALSLALDWKSTWPAVYCTYQTPCDTGISNSMSYIGACHSHA